MKFTKMKYKTMKGEVKVNCYLCHISKAIVQKAGIDDNKELVVEARNKEIVIKDKLFK